MNNVSVVNEKKKKFQNVDRYRDLRGISITLVSVVRMSTLRAVRSDTHLLILCLCLIKASPLMCARASNRFYDLPVLTSIVCSLLPHLVKSGSSSFLSEWRHHHLVSIHLLIAAGYGDHLGPAWYLAFIMPRRFKRGLCKTLSASSALPPKISA